MPSNNEIKKNEKVSRGILIKHYLSGGELLGMLKLSLDKILSEVTYQSVSAMGKEQIRVKEKRAWLNALYQKLNRAGSNYNQHVSVDAEELAYIGWAMYDSDWKGMPTKGKKSLTSILTMPLGLYYAKETHIVGGIENGLSAIELCVLNEKFFRDYFAIRAVYPDAVSDLKGLEVMKIVSEPYENIAKLLGDEKTLNINEERTIKINVGEFVLYARRFMTGRDTTYGTMHLKAHVNRGWKNYKNALRDFLDVKKGNLDFNKDILVKSYVKRDIGQQIDWRRFLGDKYTGPSLKIKY